MNKNMADTGRPVAQPADIAPFSLQPKLEGIMRTEMTQHHSVGGIVANPEYVVQAASGMISLSESYFSCQLQVESATGAAPTELSNFRPEMLLPELLWSDVDIYINSTNVSDDNGGVYPWKALAKHLLTQGEGAGQTSASMLLRPDGPAFNQPPSSATQDYGALYAAAGDHRLFASQMSARGYDEYFVLGGKLTRSESRSAAHFNGSATALFIKMLSGPGAAPAVISFAWRPKEGFWSQPGYIPASSDIRITLQHAGSRLPFRSANDVPPVPDADIGQINYAGSSITLNVRRYHLTPEAREQVSARLLQGPMHYPFTRARVARVNISQGTLNVSESALLQGPKPGVVCVFFVPSPHTTKAAGDGPAKSPWMLSGATQFPGPGVNENVAAASIYIQYGSQQIPARPYTTSDRSSPDPRAFEEYKRLCGDAGACLDYDAWATQYTSYWFDVSKAGTGDAYAPSADEGSGAVTVVADLLAQSTPTDVTMFVVGFGASHVTIDAAGNVRRLMY